MKLTLKRLTSLLLTVCLLVSGFGGFGSLTAHAQTLALKDYGHNFLYIEEDRSFQLDLTGRTGAVGAIRWQLTTADSHRTIIEGTAQYPVFTVSTSPEAAALGAAGDIVTLHGDIIAAAMGLTSDLLDAELGVTPTIPPEGIPILLHCTEEGNGTACDEIRLVAEPVEPDTPNPPDNPDQPGDTVYDVFWGTPSFNYVFENQTLFYPLDTFDLADNPEATLEFNIGFWDENGAFVSFGSNILTPQHDSVTGLITGVWISGEKLHSAAAAVIPYEYINHAFVLAAQVFVNNTLYKEYTTEGELRTSYTEYVFNEDEQVLTNNVPAQFALSTSYEFYVQFGHDRYQNNDPFAYGVWKLGTFEDMDAIVLEGDRNAVSLLPNDDDSAYILSVAPNFIGKVEIQQSYSDWFDPAQSLQHRFVLTFTDALWITWLDVENTSFLPGQQREITAHAEYYICDPRYGQRSAPHDGISLDYFYDDYAYPGVTFEYDNPLIVRASSDAEFAQIPITAILEDPDGVLLAEYALTLDLTDSYFDIHSVNLAEYMEIGQAQDIMPILYKYQLCPDKTISASVPPGKYTVEFWLDDNVTQLMSYDGTIVHSGDRFPMGTYFTYRHTAAEYASFYVNIYDADDNYIASYDYYTYTPSENAPVLEGVYRIFGQTRYETAFTVADEYKAALGAEQFENIIIASGVNFPDALAGSYLAAVKNAPILMAKVENGRLCNADQLVAYIDENLVPGGQIYVLGGPTAIPTTLEYALSGLSVKRLQGNSRYDTNLAILNEAGVTGDTLLVCTGKGYADALSASACGLPILLVDGEGTLKEAQKDFLRQHSFSKIYILGGTKAVNESYDRVLADYADTVTRLSGENRRATSVLVAETFFDSPAAAILAYSDKFPDGLCGGPLAYALGAPILLTKTERPEEAKNYAHANSIRAGYVLGGSGLISDEVTLDIFDLL